MTINRLRSADVQGMRRDTKARPNPYRSGYGAKVPTMYWVKAFDRWRRVYVMAYGNSGSAYVQVKGEDFFLTPSTERKLQELPQPCSSDASPRNHSFDLVKIWHGSRTPRIICGFHARREGLI